MKVSRSTRLSLRVIALGYLFALVGVPIAVILWRTFEPGMPAFLASVSTTAAQSAFAVSPIVVGVALIMLWGSAGWFGALDRAGFKVIFGLPGMVIATIFVTLP